MKIICLVTYQFYDLKLYNIIFYIIQIVMEINLGQDPSVESSNVITMEFGKHSLTYILQNIQIIMNRLFQLEQIQLKDTNISGEQRNYGTEMLLYMLQNTHTMLDNIIKKPQSNDNIMNKTSSTVKKVVQTLNALKDYFTPDLEVPDENEERMDDLGFGIDSTDYFKGENVTIISKGVQSLKNGKIELPSEKDITEETNIKLVRGESTDNQPNYEFIIDKKNTPQKILKLSENNSNVNIIPE